MFIAIDTTGCIIGAGQTRTEAAEEPREYEGYDTAAKWIAAHPDCIVTCDKIVEAAILAEAHPIHVRIDAYRIARMA